MRSLPLLGVRDRISYEGQAAIELEQLAGDDAGRAVAVAVRRDDRAGGDCATWRLGAGADPGWIAASFHETVAAAAAAACVEAASCGDRRPLRRHVPEPRLLDSTRRRLEAAGFRVLTHRLVPPNDGGISFGQAAVAARRIG